MVSSKVSSNIKKMLDDSSKDYLIVTNEYNDFLSKWGEIYTEEAAQKIYKLLKVKPRDRRYSWSASGAGKCLRRQEYAFLGAPTVSHYDPKLNRIFLNGTWTHLRYQATLLSAGILDAVEITVKKKSLRARCTMDGVGVAKSGRYQGSDFGFELKSANSFSYSGQLVKGVSEPVRKQVDFMMYLSGFEIFVIFNENKDNQEINEWIVVRDPNRMNEIKKMLEGLNGAVDKMKLHPQLPECKKQLKGGEFFKCPFGGPNGICANSGSWPSGI